MKNKIKVIFISFIIFFATLPAKAQETINWLSFEQLSDSLETNPKKVLIFFHTDWCSYCKKMMKETFKNEKVIDIINKDYYAVQFDAESIDTITFDNVRLTNSNNKKKRGQYHQITTLLIPQQRIVFPTTMVFDKDFSINNIFNNYLSINEFIKKF